MTTRSNSTIVLLSSGLDSSVALSMALKTHKVAFALTFDYGQRALKKEIQMAEVLSKHFGVKHRTLRLPWFSDFNTCGLLNDSSLPTPTAMQLSEKLFSEQSAKAVWVPNRNGVFIEVAASLAEAEGHSEITVGFNSEEAGTFPDNSEEYIRAISKALSYSTQNSVRVTSPTASLNKVDIVRHAKREHFPFSLIWSCYENGSKMCGKCESCMRLKRALHANEVAYAEMFTDQSFH